jgi:NDP-sugar pyrophosphorylase family protein
MIKTIFILVGGKGKRLGTLTKKTPKPLLKFNGKPFLDYILHNLLTLKTKNIYLLCGYKYLIFQKMYHNKIFGNTKITCIKEPKLLGTGGSLNYSKKLIENNTLLCNGDTYFEFDFKTLNKINIKGEKIFMACIENKNYKSNKKLSNLNIKDNILSIGRKSKLMNAGIYIFNKKIKKHLNNSIFSLENDLIEKLIIKNKIISKKLQTFSIDIGTKKNYTKFSKISNKINF